MAFTSTTDRATVTFDDGTSAMFDRRTLSQGEATMSTPPLDHQSAAASEEVTTVEVVLNGARITATSPHPVRRDLLDGLARSVTELPDPLAAALIGEGTVAPVVDEFTLGGIAFRRTLTIESPGYGVGLLANVRVVDRSALDGDSATISSNTNGVGMDLDGVIPIEHLKFVRDGTVYWLTALQPGTRPTPVGDDRLAAITDDLTGVRYALISDVDGDRAASLRVPTSTGRVAAAFTDAVA